MRTSSIEDACFFSVRVPYSTLNKVGPPFTIAKLVYKLPLRWFYDTYNYSMHSIHGVYKPTYNWGAVYHTLLAPVLSKNKQVWWYGQFPLLAMQDLTISWPIYLNRLQDLMAHKSKSTGFDGPYI